MIIPVPIVIPRSVLPSEHNPMILLLVILLYISQVVCTLCFLYIDHTNFRNKKEFFWWLLIPFIPLIVYFYKAIKNIGV